MQRLSKSTCIIIFPFVVVSTHTTLMFAYIKSTKKSLFYDYIYFSNDRSALEYLKNQEKKLLAQCIHT